MKASKQIPLRERVQKQLIKRVRARLPGAVLDRVPALMAADIPDEKVSLRDTSYPVQVTQILKETDKAVTIRFRPMEGYRLHYRAGQYVRVAVQLGSSIFRRCYSLTSSPEESDMAITVKKVFRGRVSQHLVRRLKEGDVFSIEDPQGDFVLPANHTYDSRYVMIAAGSGIAPVFALIKDILAKNPDADVLLLYSNRSNDEVIYRKALDHMAKFYRSLSVEYFFTRQGSRRKKRKLTDEYVLQQIADPSKAYIYISAPTRLTNSLVDIFKQAGIDDER
ncbi:MAG: FAD-binding oxidoreductase, partial [Pseudomonadales bacterium]|nr:FAD-binding oxidoreductase [Pseudomonadales bacterium]